MGRQNFFERIEQNLNLQNEYEKLEIIVLKYTDDYNMSLNDEIESYFDLWKYKKNYLSFAELRSHLGFTYTKSWDYSFNAVIESIDDFFLYCEMILNMILVVLPEEAQIENENIIKKIIYIINYDLESLNYTVSKMSDDQYIIIQKNAAVSEVVDLVEPTLADSILEYNHYVLKGDLERKKNILIKIANALEPLKGEIKATNYQLYKDYFYLINNMDIRHNNCDISNTKNYNEVFVKMSDQEKEEWYDEIYQMGLLIFLLRENKERSTKIANIKNLQSNPKI